MKMHEAIAALLLPENKEMWVRPCCWAGWYQAYCLDRTALSLMLVPSSRGGEYHMTYTIRHLIDDWEVVSPDTVLDGK